MSLFELIGPEQSKRIQCRQQEALAKAITKREPVYRTFASTAEESRKRLERNSVPWYMLTPEELIDSQDAFQRELLSVEVEPLKRPYGFGVSSPSRIDPETRRLKDFVTEKQKRDKCGEIVKKKAKPAQFKTSVAEQRLQLKAECVRHGKLKAKDMEKEIERLEEDIRKLLAVKREDTKTLKSIIELLRVRSEQLNLHRKQTSALYDAAVEALVRLREEESELKNNHEEEVRRLKQIDIDQWHDDMTSGSSPSSSSSAPFTQKQSASSSASSSTSRALMLPQQRRASATLLGATRSRADDDEAVDRANRLLMSHEVIMSDVSPEGLDEGMMMSVQHQSADSCSDGNVTMTTTQRPFAFSAASSPSPLSSSSLLQHQHHHDLSIGTDSVSMSSSASPVSSAQRRKSNWSMVPTSENHNNYNSTGVYRRRASQTTSPSSAGASASPASRSPLSTMSKLFQDVH